MPSMILNLRYKIGGICVLDNISDIRKIMTFISNYVYHVSDFGAWSSHVSLDKKHQAFMPHQFLQDRTRYIYIYTVAVPSIYIFFLDVILLLILT